MELIDASRVKKAYSGNPGCMCGCNGNYAYACDPCNGPGNPKLVASRVKKMNKIIANKEATEIDNDDSYLYIEYKTPSGNTKVMCVYYDL